MNPNKKWVTILAGIMAAIMVLSLLLGLLASAANAVSSGEIQNQIEQLKNDKAALDAKLEEIEKNLSTNNQNMKDMIARKNGIDQQIALLHEQITGVNQIISAYNLMIADKQDELDAAEERLAKLNAAFQERIRVMEEHGDISYWSVIFKASSFPDLLDRLNMIAEIARADRKQQEQIRETAAQVEAAKEDLAQKKAALEQTRQDLEKANESLYVKRTEADGLLVKLIALGDQYQLEMEESEKLQHELMDSILQKEDEYERAKYEEWLATSVPPTTAAPTTNPAGSGNTVDGKIWYTPTRDYWISSYFGPRTHPITGQVNAFHYGIDMAAVTGTPIYATRAGVVTVASYQEGGAGLYVNLNHGDGYTSIYMHMSRYIVNVGQRVEAGDIIGYVGSTGGSTGPHLHFGIAYKGVYVDPLKYIKA